MTARRVLFAALGAIVFSQPEPTRPVWAVVGIRDTESGRYGELAASSVTSALGETGDREVVSLEAVRKATQGPHAGTDEVGPAHIGVEIVGAGARDGTVVVGELFDHRVRDGAARADLRLVAYDVASGEVVAGALGRGKAERRTRDVSDESLLVEAIGSAASAAVEAMRSRERPTATILNTGTRTPLVNCGSRAGFVEGVRVVVIRRSRLVGRACVKLAESDQAELAFDGLEPRWAPGDRVRIVVKPPALPKRGRSGSE